MPSLQDSHSIVAPTHHLRAGLSYAAAGAAPLIPRSNKCGVPRTLLSGAALGHLRITQHHVHEHVNPVRRIDDMPALDQLPPVVVHTGRLFCGSVVQRLVVSFLNGVGYWKYENGNG